jgi:hypothetical protein
MHCSDIGLIRTLNTIVARSNRACSAYDQFADKIQLGIATVLCGCFPRQFHRVSCKHIKSVYQGLYPFQR